LLSDQQIVLAVPDGYTTALVILKGTVCVNSSETIGAAEVGLFDRAGQSICIDSAQDAIALLLSGVPIDEPIVGSGPFVMNTAQEIRQAMADYQDGKMGHLS
jgi:quercetin 2,3-dioxygenase